MIPNHPLPDDVTQFHDPAQRDAAHRAALRLLDQGVEGAPRSDAQRHYIRNTLLPRDFATSIHVLLSLTAAVGSLYRLLDADGQAKFDVARAKLGTAFTEEDYQTLRSTW